MPLWRLSGVFLLPFLITAADSRLGDQPSPVHSDSRLLGTAAPPALPSPTTHSWNPAPQLVLCRPNCQESG